MDIELEVAKAFHQKYISNPNRDDNDTLSIAVEYTNFIIDKYFELVDGYFNGTRKNN